MSKIFDTKLKIGDGKVVAYSYKSDKPMTRQAVEKKIDKIKSQFKGNFEMLVAVNTDYGFKDGKPFSNKQRVTVCNDYEWYETDSFVIYAWKEPISSGGEDDENNDCLYDCIVEIVTKFRLPKDCKEPEQLKKYLDIERDDLVPISLIPAVENYYKININVTGDFVYTSPISYPTKQTVNIILYNGHYSLNEEMISNGKLGTITKRQYKLILCDLKDGHVLCFDGEDEYNISYDTYLEAKNKIRATGEAYIDDWQRKDLKTKKPISIKKAYATMEINAKTLLELTKGKYDLSRAMWKVPNLIRRIMSYSLKGYDEPEPMDQIEQHWIYNTHCNSIIFASKINLEQGYHYDKNSNYPAIMSSPLFTFPIKKGEFSRMDAFANIVKFGIYRAEIERSGDELTDRWFRFNNENYYTHHNINHARKLGLKISLIQDGGANALLYEKNRANGQNYFRAIVQELYNIKKQCPLAKGLLSNMWGVLIEKNVIKRTTKKKQITLNDTHKLKGIVPIGGEDLMVSYMPSKQYYKYDYARIGVFLTSYNNLKMTELFYPHNKHIHQFHTDGCVSDKELDLDIGPNLGQFKLDNSGKCQINHCNNVIWS